MKHLLVLTKILVLSFLFISCDSTSISLEDPSTYPNLKITDITVGTGALPSFGNTVIVHYTGTFTNGVKFDSSKDRGVPFSFQIGVGEVIKGWDLGVSTMRIGGKRKLIIPPELGYGNKSQGPIPANSILVFEVELLGIQ